MLAISVYEQWRYWLRMLDQYVHAHWPNVPQTDLNVVVVIIGVVVAVVVVLLMCCRDMRDLKIVDRQTHTHTHTV